MDVLTATVVVGVAIVLLFDYTNGFHDASNIIATVIASRALTPIQSVIVVATFEFLGPLLGGVAVANTIGKFVTLSDVPPALSVAVVACGLFAAIFWNLLTWWFGIPSSSSHAIVGGLAGAVIISVGADHVVWGFSELMHGKFTGVTKVFLSLIVSPILGFWVGFLLYRVTFRLLARAKPSANAWLRRFQWFTSAGLAFSHGSNDAQKSIGAITLILMVGGLTAIDPATGKPGFIVPFWTILACSIAITLGILSGGWRIVRTVGFGIYKVRPIHAFSAQATSASLILSASMLGAPVSTTHVVSSAIMGIGAGERPKAVRWAKAKEIVSTWVITIPAAGIVAALTVLAVVPFVK